MTTEHAPQEHREIIRILYRWRKHILITTALGLLVSVIISMPSFIPPLFRSEAIIYPPSSNTNSFLIERDLAFGYEKELDEHIQILQSAIMRDSITRKFDLISHYEIDTAGKFWRYNLNEAYDNNISIARTRYNSIAVSVYDTDPELSANMANAIVEIGDRIKGHIIKQNLRTAFNSLDHDLKDKIAEVDQLADSIMYIKERNYLEALALRKEHYLHKKKTVENLRQGINNIRNNAGIYNMDKQFNLLYKEYTKAGSKMYRDSGKAEVLKRELTPDDSILVYTKANLAGSKLQYEQYRKKLDEVNRLGATYNALFDDYTFEKDILSGVEADYEYTISTFDKDYSDLTLETLTSRYEVELQRLLNIKGRYEVTYSNLYDNIPEAYVISPAEPANKKSSPKRSLIVIISTICSFLAASIAVVVLERWKELMAYLKSS